MCLSVVNTLLYFSQVFHYSRHTRHTYGNFGISVATYFSQWLMAQLFILGRLSQQACFFSGNNKLIPSLAETKQHCDRISILSLITPGMGKMNI